MKNETASNWMPKLVLLSAITTLAICVAGLSGCATLDRVAYAKEVTWTNTPALHVFTNTVVLTNTVEEIVERTSVLYVTNEITGAVSGVLTREPVATNLVPVLVTNLVPVFTTNILRFPVTNLVARPETQPVIDATGSILNTFLPGIGSMIALLVGGLYHGYRQFRNRRVNEALVQGVETARAILATTPQGKAADAQFVKWLMEHQKEAGVFVTVSQLVEQLTDNPAARLTAQEIAERMRKAERGSGQSVPAA